MATKDNLLISALHGTAWRRSVERGNMGEAILELRELAGGRNDLLAQSAGITAGSWSATPSTCVGTELFVAGLLIAAGYPLPYSELDRWVQLGRERGLQHRRPIYG